MPVAGDKRRREDKDDSGALVTPNMAKKEGPSSIVDMVMKFLMMIFSFLTGKNFPSMGSGTQEITPQSIQSFFKDPKVKEVVSEVMNNPLAKQLLNGFLKLPGIASMAQNYLEGGKKIPGFTEAVQSSLKEVPGLKSFVADVVKGTPLEKGVKGLLGEVGRPAEAPKRPSLSAASDSPLPERVHSSGSRP